MCARRVHQHPAYIPRTTHSRDQALIMKRNMPLRASLAPWLSELFLEPKWASTSERARGLRARAYARPGPTFNSGTNISCLMAPCLSTLRLRTYVRSDVRTYVDGHCDRTYVRFRACDVRTYVRLRQVSCLRRTYVRTSRGAYVRSQCRAERTYVRTYAQRDIANYVRTYVRTHVRTYVRAYMSTYVRTCVRTCVRKHETWRNCRDWHDSSHAAWHNWHNWHNYRASTDVRMHGRASARSFSSDRNAGTTPKSAAKPRKIPKSVRNTRATYALVRANERTYALRTNALQNTEVHPG